MLKRILAICLTLTLSFTIVGCGSSNTVNTTNKPATNFTNNTSIPSNNIPAGKYPVQQATFNDVDGEYSLMLLNTPAGSSPTFRTTNLQMARLTDEEIKAGETTYAEIKGNEAVMHLTEDFRIEYVHNETQTVTNPDTGRTETVVVRQQSSFWSPFAGALAGQALGSLLFRPQYYVPPAYQPGGTLTGFGGYGSSYNQAVQSYRNTYNAPPAVEKNRQSIRTTGTLKNSSNSTTKRVNSNSTKSTGSGFGASNLKTNNNSSSKVRKPSRNSFGSSSPSKSYRRTSPTRRSGGGFGSRGISRGRRR